MRHEKKAVVNKYGCRVAAYPTVATKMSELQTHDVFRFKRGLPGRTYRVLAAGPYVRYYDYGEAQRKHGLYYRSYFNGKCYETKINDRIVYVARG